MKLADLYPRFLRVWFEDIEGMPRQRYETAPTLEEAQGLQFQCPVCRDTAHMPHWVTLLNERAPAASHPIGIRVGFVGASVDDLTLINVTPAPALDGFATSCGFVGTIRNGELVSRI